MKPSFRPKANIPWRTIIFFMTLAAIWHLPLWWVYSKRAESRIMRLEIPAGTPDVRLVFQPLTMGSSEKLFSWLDPTLYLLPDERGFSRGLRSHVSKKEGEDWYAPATQPPDLSEPLQVEKPEVSHETSPLPPWVFASSLGNVESNGSSVLHENPASGESAWHVTGAIKDRLIQPYPTFPGVHSSEVLAPTLLRLGITPSGDPQFVVLETGSGSDEADQLGILFAQKLRFSPSEEPAHAPVAWGYLKILWQAGEK